MTYLDEVATEIERRVPRELLPDEDVDSLFRLYAVLALAKGSTVNAVDVHNAWAAWMLERDPGHRSIKPFDELDADTQASDAPFVEAITGLSPSISTRYLPDSSLMAAHGPVQPVDRLGLLVVRMTPG
jgi:hypothetical protein